MRRERVGRSLTRARILGVLCASTVLGVAGSGAVAASASASLAGVGVWGNGNDTPVAVEGVIDASSVAAGAGFKMALLPSGKVAHWSGSTVSTFSELSEVKAISAASGGALSISGEGVVKAWGSQPSPSTEDELVSDSTWTPVECAEGASAVSQGSIDPEVPSKDKDLGVHDLALKEGKVLAWGDNEHGQLGDGSTSYSGACQEVSGLKEVIAVSAGGGQSLALLKGGTVMAWGEDEHGQLGDGKAGKKYDSDVPVAVSGLSHVVAVAAGGEDSFALLEGGTVMAWGNNRKGDLGLGEGAASSYDTPQAIPGLSEVTAIAASATGNSAADHNFALLSDGKVLGWGIGSGGDLGDGSTENRESPTAVSSIADVTSIAAGTESGVAAGPPFPIATGVVPAHGLVTGGNEVEITGQNLGEATSVDFGSHAAAILSDGETSITVLAPAQEPKKVNVVVTTPIGSSLTSRNDDYLYEPEGGIVEFGRCLSVGKGLGDYSKSNCTEASAGGKYEWTTEIANGGFTVADKETVDFETSSGTLVECRGAGGGSGEYSGSKSVGNLVLDFTECFEGTSKSNPKCTSAGAAEGEIKTVLLEGEIGYENVESDNVAIELLPVEGAGDFMTFECGSTAFEVRGEAFGGFTPVNNSNTSMKINFAGSKGKPRIEGFRGATGLYLEASRAGGAFAKMNIGVQLLLANEEAVEVNTVV